ncbi:MAG: hypothetical protein QXV18_01325 [Candidatus Nitrosocaldus sp.]
MHKEGGESINEAVIGFMAGCIATGVISIIQYPFWKRWGMIGVLEWHENQCLMSMLFKRNPETLVKEGFMLHFLNGGLAALFYAIIVKSLSLISIDPNLLGISFGLLLWILTLAPIHKPITGVNITRHPLGYKPILLSLVAHVVYGIIVAHIVVIWLG